jgi:Ca2+-binding RTX toxin-like protein
MQTLDMLGTVTLAADQLNAFTTIEGAGELDAAVAGTYSLAGKTNSSINIRAYVTGDTTLIGNDAGSERLTVGGAGNDTLILGNGNNDVIDAGDSTGNVTLTAGDGNNDVLIAGSGNDTLIAGNGNNNELVGGAGNDTLIVGNGQGNTLITGTGTTTAIGGSGNTVFVALNGLSAGTALQGGVAGTNVLQANGDITNANISDIQTLDVRGNVTLTLDQFNSFATIEGGTLTGSTAGTYSASGKIAGQVVMSVSVSGDTTLIGNDAAFDRLDAGGTGTKTLILGNGDFDTLDASESTGDAVLTTGDGNNDVLIAGAGNDILITGNGNNARLHAGAGTDTMTGGTGTDTFFAGTGSDTMYGGGGDDTYIIGPTFGQDVINNYHTDNGMSVIQLAPGITASDLTLSQSGNNLVITIGGGPITVHNYFTGADYQISAIQFSDGTSLNNADILSQFSKEWGGASGNWTDTTKWVGGSVPASTLNAELGGSGTYTVAVSTADTIHNLSISDVHATLSDTGSLTVNWHLANNGAIIVNGGALTVTGPVTGTGSMTIDSGTVELGGADAGTVTFAGNGTLKLDQPQNFTGTIAGLVPTDTLDLGGVSATSASISGNTLTVNETGGSTLTLNMTGIPTGATVQVSSDGHGGSDLTFAPPENDVALTDGDDKVTGLADSKNVFSATVDTLNPGDQINGAASDAWTSDTLQLQGGGWFDLTSLTALTNINTMDLQEGVDATYQTVRLRDGLNSTVNVADGSDPSTDGIMIIGGNNVSTINLGTGQDTYIENYGNAGTIVNGTGANSTLDTTTGDISQITVNDVANLETQYIGSLTLTAAELSEFTTINTDGGALDLIAAGAGTYDLTGKTLNNEMYLDARQTSANVTLKAGSGAAMLISGAGVDTLIGGTGNDLFYLDGSSPNGTTIAGGSGTNTLQDDYTTDISQMNITGMQTLNTYVGALTLTANQLSQFSTINANGGPLDIVAAGAGTYDLTGKTLSNELYLDARQTSANVTLKAGSGDAVLLSGAGVDTLVGGTGNDLFYLDGSSPVGTTMTGGSGTNTLEDDYTSDISQMNITGMQTLKTYVGALTMTAAQLSQFSTIEADGGPLDIVAAGAGTYDLTGKTLTNELYLDARGTTENVTLKAGSGDAVFFAGAGDDTLLGGTGDDTFYTGYDAPGPGTTIDGGGGSNTLNAQVGDISGMNITGIQSLNAYGLGAVTLTADQFSEFNTINAGQTTDLIAAGAGTYDLTGKTLDSEMYLDASQTSDNVTLKAGSGDAILIGGSGVDTLIGGAGNDTFYTGYTAPSGTTIDGGGGSNTLNAQVGDISGMNITDIQTLNAYGLGAVTLTADQLAEFSTINAGQPTALVAAGAGTYDLTGKTLDSVMSLDASQTSADVTLIGNDQDGQTLVGGAGSDTLVAGTGTDVTLYGGSGATTYQFGSSFGQDTINNDGANSTPANQINFGAGITDEKLWFQQSGDDLQIDLLGTNDTVAVANWFAGDTGAQVQSINADGYTLATTQVQQLVQAMATYQTNNSGFNPTTATAMPTDSTLQNAIAASWQHA